MRELSPAQQLARQLARTQRFSLGVPSQFTVTGDGAAVLFLRSRAGDDPVSCLWRLDLGSGQERLLADPATLTAGRPAGKPAGQELPEEERTRRERARQQGSGIVSYATDAAATLAAFTVSGVLHAVAATGGQVRRLPAVATDPRPDPAGQRIGYVRDGALRVIEADGTADRLVAGPDGPDVTFGLAEHAAAESMGRTRGYWWAPDGHRLLVARVDSAAVTRWYIADPARPGQPPRAVRYPAAGTANAAVTLWLARLDGTRTEVGWDRDRFEYVAAAGWDDRGPYAAVQSRDQRTVQLLGIDPADGSTRLLAEQRDECWVQLIPGLPARTRSGAWVGHADQPGTRQLTVGGTPVTPPGLQLLAVLSIDGDEVLFTACTEPTQAQLWIYRPGRGARPLITEPGVHTGIKQAGTLVHVARTADRPGARVTATRPRHPLVPIASLAEPPAGELRVTPLVLGPRELRSMLFLPSWHRPGGRRLPVLLDPYAGPALQKVTADQAPWSFLSQWFAEQGFAVLVTDGRGTPGRGPGWEREIYGDIFGPALEDQVTALTEAGAQHPDLDLQRVGIRGWSFSGSLATLAVLRYPEVFHAAVAGAGVSDQRLYETHWRERFLGHPDQHPDAYDACSLLAGAAQLSRPLLLIHGLADDNVFPVNTLRLSAALLAAGRPHEVLLLPGVTHQPGDGAVAENLLWHQARFLQRHLGACPPGQPAPGPA